MNTTRRSFLRLTGLATAGLVGADAIEAVARGRLTPAAAGLALETLPSGKPFRMTEEWYRRQIRALQTKLGERGLKGIVLKDPNNLNYLTGIFLTTTERQAWMLRGVAKRGGGDGRVGVEAELTPGQHKAMTGVLPKAELVPAGDLVLTMRIRKTPEEIA